MPKPRRAEGLALTPERASLAPGLPRHLILPEALSNLKGSTLPVIHRLLLSFGLSDAESVRLQNEVLQLSTGYEFPRFAASPVSSCVPSAMPPGTVEQSEVDYPDIGVFHFRTRVWFSASDRQIIREFGLWLRRQRRLMHFRKWTRVARRTNLFHRDLVVFALCEVKGWSADQICAQIAYMALPSLAASPDTPIKGAIASIRYKVRRYIKNAEGKVISSLRS